MNVPAPLISSFVEDQNAIFGAPIDETDSPISNYDQPNSLSVPQQQQQPLDLRSPRKQMFSDLPTPAYNQTSFENSAGMAPMHPTYASYQMAPQGDGGYGSLNDALRSPTVYSSANSGVPSERERGGGKKKRESSMLGFSLGSAGLPKKSSMSRLREDDGGKF